jgi:hypothetical protein
MDEQIPSHLIPVLEEYERQNISKIEEAFSINKDGMSRAERRALKRKLSKSNLKSSVSKFNKINKAKAIDLMRRLYTIRIMGRPTMARQRRRHLYVKSRRI